MRIPEPSPTKGAGTRERGPETASFVAGLLPLLVTLATLAAATPAAVLGATPDGPDAALARCEAERIEAATWFACGCYRRLARSADGPPPLVRRAVEALEELDRAEDTCAAYMLGRLADDRRDFPAAAVAFSRAARRAATGNEHQALAWARARLGETLRQQNRLVLAAPTLELAVEAAELAEDTEARAEAILTLEKIRLRQGSDLRAIESRIRALLESSPDLSKKRQGRSWSLLGSVRWRLGHAEEAVEAYGQAQQVFLELGDDGSALVEDFNLALVWLDSETADRQKAIPALEKVVREARQLEIAKTESTALAYLGGLLGGSEGLGQLHRSLELANEIGFIRFRFEALEELASSLATRDPIRARNYLDEAETLVREGEDVSLRPYLAEPRMRVGWALASEGLLGPDAPPGSDPQDPLGAFARIGEMALDELEQTTDLQLESGAQGELFSTWIESNDWLVGALLAESWARAGSTSDGPQLTLDRLDAGPVDLRETRRLDDSPALEDAFRTLERRRSRLLRRALAKRAQEARDQAQRGELDALRGEMESIYRQLLSGKPTPEERSSLDARLGELEAREGQLARQAEARDREEQGHDAELDFVDLATARTTLAEDEALVIFQLAPWQDVYQRFYGGSWVWIVSRDRHWLRPLDGPRRLGGTLELFGGLLPARDGSELRAARKVGERLFGSVLEELPSAIDHLLILPDGPLHLMPFSALVTGEGPLGQRFRLSRLPSVTLWREWRLAEHGILAEGDTESTLDGAGHTLVLADPALPTAAGTPSGRGTAGPGARSETRAGTLELARTLGRLPGAAAEGRSIRRRLGRTARVLTGPEASETALENLDLGPYGILHFAAHALVDTEKQGRSGVVLARGGEADDGLLQPREIERLELAGRLVVLSACQSADGRILRGEGPSSLARAFHQAGARAVVAGLWKLRDDEARRFFETVYGRLAEGADVATAVREGRIALAESGLPTEAWSGLVVLGDGALRPFPGGLPASNLRPWILGGVLLLLGLGAPIVGRRLRRRTRKVNPGES